MRRGLSWNGGGMIEPTCGARLGNRLRGTGIVDAASAHGFLNESEIIDRYADRTGRDLTRIGFYLGRASFKLAAIIEGIHFRHLSGQTVGAGF